jgi:hypothetical protein
MPLLLAIHLAIRALQQSRDRSTAPRVARRRSEAESHRQALVGRSRRERRSQMLAHDRARGAVRAGEQHRELIAAAA